MNGDSFPTIGYVIEFLIAKEVLLQLFGFRND